MSGDKVYMILKNYSFEIPLGARGTVIGFDDGLPIPLIMILFDEDIPRGYMYGDCFKENVLGLPSNYIATEKGWKK